MASGNSSFLDHGRLLIQRRQVGGAGDIEARRPTPAVDVQRGGVVGHGRAQNRDVAGGRHGGLQRGRGVGHDQVHAVGHEGVDDGRTGVGIAGGVLHVKADGVAQLLGQRVLEALGGGVQRLVLHQLADAHGVGLLGNGGHAQAQHGGDHYGKQFLHVSILLRQVCIIKAALLIRESRLNEPWVQILHLSRMGLRANQKPKKLKRRALFNCSAPAQATQAGMAQAMSRQDADPLQPYSRFMPSPTFPICLNRIIPRSEAMSIAYYFDKALNFGTRRPLKRRPSCR